MTVYSAIRFCLGCKDLTHSEESVQTHASRRLSLRAPVFFRLLSHHSPAPATLLTIPPKVIDSSGHANASLSQLEGALTFTGVEQGLLATHSSHFKLSYY